MTENKMALLIVKDTVENLDHEDKITVMGYVSDLQSIITKSKEAGEEEYG